MASTRPSSGENTFIVWLACQALRSTPHVNGSFPFVSRLHVKTAFVSVTGDDDVWLGW